MDLTSNETSKDGYTLIKSRSIGPKCCENDSQMCGLYYHGMKKMHYSSSYFLQPLFKLGNSVRKPNSLKVGSTLEFEEWSVRNHLAIDSLEH